MPNEPFEPLNFLHGTKEFVELVTLIQVHISFFLHQLEEKKKQICLLLFLFCFSI